MPMWTSSPWWQWRKDGRFDKQVSTKEFLSVVVPNIKYFRFSRVQENISIHEPMGFVQRVSSCLNHQGKCARTQSALFVPLPACGTVATWERIELVLGSSHSHLFGILFGKLCKTILLRKEKAWFSDTRHCMCMYDEYTVNTYEVSSWGKCALF